jgi:hypothetical protein
MVSRRWLALLVLALLALCLVAPASLAQDDKEDSAAEASEAVEKAKRLFRQGVELFNAGDRQRALELFMASREAYPSVQNTSNVAITLDELGRYDEALEMYELLLVEFKDELDDKDRKALGPAMAALRKKVGSVFISANVDGKVVIDGRARAQLPLTVPIRVLPGERQIRVIRSGYVTWETQRKVELGKTVRIDAKLEPLAEAGLLRVEDAKRPGATVFVDGAPMGPSPWEGTLGPGPHLVWTADGDLGSAPREVVVVQGQTAVVQLESQPLGPPVDVVVEPATAVVSLGTAKLGEGRWSGRLPAGDYELSASEEGYHSQTKKLSVAADGSPQKISLELEVDPDHPRWPKSAEGEGFVQAWGGFAFGPGFGADAEENCVTCSDDTTVLGLAVGARGGYRFPFGLALEVGAGYIRLGTSFDRVSELDDQAGVQYAISDDLLVHGPFASFGLSYRYRFGEYVAASARASAGAFFESATDDVTAEAIRGDERAPLAIQDPEPVARSISVFAQGDLAFEVHFGGFHVAAAMGILVFPTDGATLDERSTSIGLDCDPTMPDGIGCIRSGTPIPDERAHQLFFAGLPQLQVGYAF